MFSYRLGGADGREVRLTDDEDLVVVRTRRRGARHDLSPLSASSRRAQDELRPLFGFSASGVGVFEAPKGRSRSLAEEIDADSEVEFAGRGLRDDGGAPVVYTENLFVKFVADLGRDTCERVLTEHELESKRALSYAENAYFVAAPPRSGRAVFETAAALLDRSEVELCHPELVREVGWNGAFPQQWHLAATRIGDTPISAHANVEPAWELSRGEGAVVAIIDDGVDLAHPELSSDEKIVAPRSLTPPRGESPHPGPGDNHGTACAGVACGDGNHGASGVAPAARLMPLRLRSGLGSQDEADAFVWAAEHGADVISCSWGPVDGNWANDEDPAHDRVVPLPDSTRLAIEFALSEGRNGKGCVIAWAAGNGSEDVGNDGYASYEGVIAVAACNDRGTRSVYSDYGEAIWCCFPSNDFGEPVQTPGIWTIDRPGIEGYNPGSPTLGDEAGDYVNSFGGTSSAAPGLAGVLALMLSRNPDLGPTEVRELLRGACDQIDRAEGQYDDDGHSPYYGYGRVNALAAVEAAAAASESSETAGQAT